MKKIQSIYMALAAMLILGWTACTDDDPITVTAHMAVAEFTVEWDQVDDTKITLHNSSQYGIKYLWAFGDGTTSTEENPTHTYIQQDKKIDYEIKLTTTSENGYSNTATEVHTVKGSGSINPEPETDFEITLDGNFADWLEVPAANLIEHELDVANSTLHSLKKVMLCANKEYIYLYVKMNSEHANAMDIYMNVDGGAKNGYNSWMWNSIGADYYLQGTFDSKYDMKMSQYDESKGGGWGWISPAIIANGENAFEISEMKTVEGTIVEFEGRISRKQLTDAGVKLRSEVQIAIGHSGLDGDKWSTSGGMPTVLSDGDKNEPFEVLLP